MTQLGMKTTILVVSLAMQDNLLLLAEITTCKNPQKELNLILKVKIIFW